MSGTEREEHHDDVGSDAVAGLASLLPVGGCSPPTVRGAAPT
jgi:hypothetical protein